MSMNPYAPPAAAVADIAAPEDVATEPPFFAVSVLKLTVMTLCTFSIYEVYWFYKHWQRIAEREREPIWPLARAFFAVFYCYGCFSRIRDHERAGEVGTRLHALALTIGFIVVTLMWRLPEPYDWISMTAFLFLLPVQHFANQLNALESPSHDRNSRFAGWNWVALIVGGSLLLLAVAGEFLVPPEA
jgi:hypothetical protein